MLNKFRKQGNGFIVNRDGVGTVACVYPDYFMVEPENQKKQPKSFLKVARHNSGVNLCSTL